MLSKILMPSGGQTTDELVILQWEKKVGDFVKRGDTLFEIETDKADLTVESYAEGTLLAILCKAGARVKAGEIVAYIGDLADRIPDNHEHAAPLFQKETSVSAVLPKKESTPSSARAERKKDTRIYASPLAKRRARLETVSLEDVASFVSKVVVQKDDIAKYLTQIRNGNDQHEADAYFIDATSIRKTIAKRVKNSLAIAPHFVISVDIDMTALMALRRKLHDRISTTQVKISIHDFIMKAVAKTIEHHPLVNANFLDDKIKVYKNVHFGLAVALEAGLVVPVIKNVNHQSLGEIAMASAAVIEKVRDGRMSEADVSGGTITLSNLGMYGMKEFTAIINQPESCILAAGAIIEKPVSIHREVHIRDIMNITASFDHRVIDGAVGAAFLRDVKQLLESPHLLTI